MVDKYLDPSKLITNVWEESPFGMDTMTSYLKCIGVFSIIDILFCILFVYPN